MPSNNLEPRETSLIRSRIQFSVGHLILTLSYERIIKTEIR